MVGDTHTIYGFPFSSVMLFSVASVSAACGLLYLTCFGLLQRNYPQYDSIFHQTVALCTSLAFTFGFTSWYWANNVEVYAFQVFTLSLMAYGLVEFNHSRKTKDVVIAATGVA